MYFLVVYFVLVCDLLTLYQWNLSSEYTCSRETISLRVNHANPIPDINIKANNLQETRRIVKRCPPLSLASLI